MPAQRLLPTGMPLYPGREIALSTSDIEVHTWSKPRTTQTAYLNSTPLSQVKDCYVRTALYHMNSDEQLTTPDPSTQRQLRQYICPPRIPPVHLSLVVTDTDMHQKPARGLIMATTSKKDLVNRIAERTETKQVLVKAVVQQFFDAIICELAKGNRLEFRDFAVFETKTSAPRTAQNPKTLERVQVPAKRRIVFKAGRLMKEGVNATPLQHSA